MYSVTVMADDGTYSDSRDVTVTVTNVEEPVPAAPMFATETDTREVAENTAADTAIGAPVAATDPNNDTLTYSLGGSDAESFGIGTATGQLMTKAALDHETESSYMVTVTATDAGGDTDTVTVTVTVMDVDEPGTVTLDNENPEAGTEITASLYDGDMPDTVAWQWSSADAMDGTFTDIDGATTAMYMPVTADAGNFLRATASYNDGHADQTAMATAANAVTVNSAPVFDEGETATRSVEENTAAGESIGAPVAAMDENADDTLTYELGGTDAASFAIEASTGQLMTSAALDFEMKASYTVTVTATDPSTEAAMITVTITVTDVTLNEVGEAYDGNDDEQIDRSEVNTAIRAYFAVGSTVIKADVVEVIRLYFASVS